MQVGFRVECRHRDTRDRGVFGAEGEIDQTKPDQSRRDNPEISPLTEKKHCSTDQNVAILSVRLSPALNFNSLCHLCNEMIVRKNPLIVIEL